MINLKNFYLQMFAVNATVASGSTGALDTTGLLNVPYSNHAYAAPNADLSAEMKVFYQKQLLEEAKPNLVHDQLCQKRPIPAGNGKTTEFRKFSSLPKALTPITEGVKPAGQKLHVSVIPATVEQYGDFVQQTDMLELTAIDPIVAEANKMLADQAGRTIDSIVRNVMQTVPTYFYAPKVSGGSTTEVKKPAEMDATCHLSVDLIKDAETALKNQNAKKFGDSYVAVVHPTAARDLKSDDDFIDVMKYASPEKMLNGEIGKISGVRIVETTEAKIYRPTIELGTGNTVERLTVTADAVSTASRKINVNEVLADASSLSGKKMWLNGDRTKEFTVTTVDNHTTYSTLTMSEDTYANSAAVIKKDDVLVPASDWSTSDGAPVFSTLVVAENAFGSTEIEGGGLESIVKPKGSSGAMSDPLNQVSSEGWKCTKAAVVLNGAYAVNILSCSNKFNLHEN